MVICFRFIRRLKNEGTKVHRNSKAISQQPPIVCLPLTQTSSPSEIIIFTCHMSSVNILEEGFLQDPPRLGNQFLEDTALREALQRLIPDHIYRSIEPDLVRFGDRVLEDVTKWGIWRAFTLLYCYAMMVSSQLFIRQRC